MQTLKSIFVPKLLWISEDLPCESDPCLHGATCNNTDNSGFVCHCRVGYEGATCDTRSKF